MNKNKKIGVKQASTAAGLPSALMAVVDECARLYAVRRYDEMSSLLVPALRERPEDPNLNSLMGQAALGRGEHQVALAHFDKALAQFPDHIELLIHRAVVLTNLDRKIEAKEILEALLERAPDNFLILKNLGALLAERGENERAEGYFRKALYQDEHDVELLCLLGRSLVDLSREDEAKLYLKRAIKLKRYWPTSFNILGTAYRNKLCFRVAHSFYRYALKLSPEDSNSIINYGVALIDMGRVHEAIAHFKEYLKANPDSHQARFNLGTLLLAIGRLDDGWEAYEARRKLHTYRDRFVPYPDWQGESLDGKNILILSEQGIGDEILAASMFDELIASAGHCIVECDPRLVSVFSRSFPEATVVPRLPNEIVYPKEHVADVKLPGMSLARWFRGDMSRFPGKTPYLNPDTKRRDYWRWRLSQLGSGLKVGISWRSLLTVGVRRDSYSTLDEWTDIFSVQGIHFINLQYGFRSEEIEEAETRHGVRIANFSDIDLKDGIEDVVALMSELDVVVAPDNTVAVLAGALNVPTLQFVLSKYWSSLGRDYYPWHPSVKLFFRAWDRDWTDSLRSISVELQRMVCQHQLEESIDVFDVEHEHELIRERIGRGALFLQGKSFEKAKAIFSELLVVVPQHPEATLLLGLAEKGLGNRAMAQEIISRAINLDPLFAEAYNQRGALLLEMGRGNESIPDFERAIALRPGYPDALNNYGNALAEQKRFAEAAELYQRAINGLSGFIIARYNLGLTFEHLGRVSDALIEYETVVDSDPGHADAWNNLANLYGHLRLHDEAIKAYRKSLEANPDFPVSKINLAKRLLLSDKSSEEAIQLLESVMDRVGGDYKLMNTLGVAYAQNGNLSMAIEKFKGAIDLAPDYIDAYRNLGLSLQKMGRLEEARDVLGKALLLASAQPDKLH